MKLTGTVGAFKQLPHVGRAAELSLMSDWLSDVSSGHGGIHLVAGQSGIGKTRLALTISDRAERDKWTVTIGRAHAVESGVPYAMWSDVLLNLLEGLDAPARNALTRGGGWLGTICPAFAGTANDDTDGRDAKARLLWNCTQFLTRLSERRPLLLVLENLQFADNASMELLHFVARQVGKARVAIVATYNELEMDRNPPLRDMEQSLLAIGAAKLMRLDALTQSDVETIVATVFSADHPAARQLSRRLYAWTRGHPFFVEETLKSLVESGRLYQRDGRWLGWETKELDLPSSVRSAVGKRLEQLDVDARNVAGVAAVIGARVRFRDLQAVSALSSEGALAALDELCRVGLLVESPRSQDGDYDFAHPIIQDVIYVALGPARARSLHTAIARALEASFAHDSLAHAEVLAFHFSRADAEEDRRRAARYLAAAGRDALARHADQSAADYLSAALERQSAEHDPSLVDDLAQARQRLGEYDAAMALWLRARTEAELRGDLEHSAGVERQMGLACYWSGRYEEALAHYDAALASAKRPGSRAQIQLNRATCWQSLGRAQEAERDVSAALAAARELGDPRLLARAHNTAMFLRVFIGPPETARDHGMQGLALAEDIGDRMIAWSANYGLTLLAGLTGDAPSMVTHMQRSEQLADEQQSPLLRSHSDELSMQYRFASGDWDGGLALAEQTIATARVLNQRNLLPRVLVWATHFYVARGEFQRAKPYLDEAWELGVARAARGRPVDLHTQVAVHSGLAAYHLATGDYASAVSVGEQGLAVADAAGYIVWATYRLLPVITEAAFWGEDLRRAQRLRDRMKQDCDRLGHSLGLVWVDAADGLLCRLHRDYDEAARHLGRAIQNLDAIPWVYDAARLRFWLADVLVRLGRTDQAMQELKRSHELCARLGALPELDRTRTMMKELGMRLPGRRASRGDGGRRQAAQLTGRERDIARLVVARKSNKEIGVALGISTRTVTTHLANIFAKTGIGSRGEFADRMREAADFVPGEGTATT